MLAAEACVVGDEQVGTRSSGARELDRIRRSDSAVLADRRVVPGSALVERDDACAAGNRSLILARQRSVAALERFDLDLAQRQARGDQIVAASKDTCAQSGGG